MHELPRDRSLAPAPGRAVELAALRRAYRDAGEGSLRLLVLDGTASSPRPVLEAWLGEHRAGGVLTVDASRPGALERLVTAGLEALGPIRRATHPARLALSHASHPAMAQPAPEAAVLDLLAESERRIRLREGALRLAGDLGSAGPAVIVLEGMERPERAILDLLDALVPEEGSLTAPPRVLFAAVLEAPPSARLAGLARRPGAEVLALRPLDRESLREVLAESEVLDAILSLTGGRPERLERLLRGEALLDDERPAEAVQAALELLAILATPTDDATFISMCSEPVEPSALARAGAVRGAGTWHLAPALRARVEAALPPARARSLHARAAQILAERDPAAAARHALAAASTTQAVLLALRGAEALLARHAPMDAADLLLAVAEAHEAEGLAVPRTLRARLAELAWIAGAHDEALAHAAALCDEGATVADRVRHGRLLALAGRHADAVEALGRAHLEDPCPEVSAALAEARCRAGDLEGAASLAERVLSETGGLDVPAGLEAEKTRAKVELARGAFAGAEARLRRVLAHAEAHALPRSACEALNNLAIVAMARGELGQARAWLTRASELADAHGALFHRGIAHKNLAIVEQLEGRWDRAIAHGERALLLLSGLADPSLRARLAFNTADLYRSLGDPYRALRLCAHARAQAGSSLDALVHGEGARVEAAIQVELGRLAEARRAYGNALGATEGQPAAHEDARIGLALVEVALGRREAALHHLAVLEASPAVPTRDARAAARIARLHAALAEGSDAVPLARLAVEAARATQDPLLVQDARLELAAVLTRAGLTARAEEELVAVRASERALAARAPAELASLFTERATVRRLLELERAIAQGAQAERREAGAAHRAPARSSRGSVRPGSAPAREPSSSVPGSSPMVGDSPPMRALRQQIAAIGPSDATVLLSGESGTGKELAAEALHLASARRDAPLIRVNCAALVDELLASELFGHERGAFTGADRQRKGRFELADGGTLFLDEIGDISPRMQAALLRVLQEGTFERVGGSETLRVNVRVIAATHRDLAARVQQGLFREDLYYRLSGITLRLPALRERASDVPALARHLLETLEPEVGPRTLADDALAALSRRRWPGNVRELANVLRRAAVLSPGARLCAADLDEGTDAPVPPLADASLGALVYERVRGGQGSIYEVRKRLERELIERALDDAGGNISKAAELLGMKRPRLSKLVNELGMKP